MALDTDSMIDRRRLKRRLALWRIVALGAVLGLIAVAIGRAPRLTAEDHVAVLWIEGMILTDPYREEAIRALTVDDSVSALIVHIDSPGGTTFGSEALYLAVAEVSEVMPVVAVMNGVAASGGYWLACAADEIYAERSSIVGSIGVVSAGFGFEEAIRKIGVERRVHHQGANKAMLDPFRAEDPDDVERLLDIQRAIHDDFKDHVRDRRGKRLKGEDDDLFNGDIWTGTAALNLGLIDGIGELRGVMRDRFGDKVQLRVVGAERGWLRRRLGMHGDWAEPRSITTGVLAAIEERALWSRFGL